MDQFQQIVTNLSDNNTEKAKRRQELQDQKVITDSLKSVERAVIRTTTVLIQNLSKELKEVKISNHPKSIKTPDSLTASTELKSAIKELQKVVDNKNVDLKPILSQLEALERGISKLPTEYPSFPEYPSEMAVNNLQEVTKCLDDLKKELQAIEFSPKITVNPTKVDVKVPDVNVDLKELKELKKAIKEIKFPDSSQILSTLIKSTEDVAIAVRSIQFPVPNFRAQDIVDAVVGRTEALRVEIDTTNSPVIYFGKADPSASKDDPVWQISKADTTTGFSKSFPNGDSKFNYIWEERTTLTYS
jgi:hypothetical protein